MKSLRRLWFFVLVLSVFLPLGSEAVWRPCPAEAKIGPFPEMSGWKLAEEPQVFSPNNLYDYIDGAADLYLKLDFQELEVVEYRNEKKAAVTIEVYRHRTSDHAFGIYSQERLADANFLNIGAQGYYENNVLNFVKGLYYVKMSSYNTGADDREILLGFGRKVAQNLEGKNSLPAILSSFPPEGKKKNSEKFISREFLGYSFLLPAFTADYDLAGKKFQVFVIEGRDQNDCRNMMKRYLKEVESQEKEGHEGLYRIKDRYHGEIDLFWKGKYIWGTLNLDVPDLRSKYIKSFEDFYRAEPAR